MPNPFPKHRLRIRLRVQQAEHLARMLGDRDWQVDERALPAAYAVVGYFRADWHLLPTDLPQAARLDDALAIDTACRSCGRN